MEEKPRQLFYLKRQPPHDGQNLIIPFKREEVVIGRSPDSHYMITNQCISRKHAVFIKNGDVWTVRNLSLNGVFINGILVPKDEEQTISVGSMIQIGQPDIYVYRFGMKLASGKSRQSTSQNNTNPHLTQERDTLDARLQENDLRYQKLVDTKNQLQEELDLEKQKMNEKYEADRKKLEDKHTEGSMAQQAMLAEKQELADKLEKEVIMLQSKLESERTTLEEQLANEEHQREELLHSKDEVMKQLNAEKADLERRLEEERNRLEDQRRATEDYKKELQEQMDAKEELIQRKEEELSEAEQRREQIAKQQEEIKQRLQEQLDEVSLKFEAKDTENSMLDKELKNKEEQLKQEMRSLEEAMERRMKEAVEAKETEIQQDAQKQLQSLKDDQNELQAKLLQAQETDRHQLDEMRNALDTLEAQKMSLEQELESSAVASQLARKEVVESVCDVMDNEFQCPICSELFMTAILLNCGHTFCKFCIDTWKKNKKDCPNCRQKITSENRSVVVDNFISKIVITLSEEIRNRREEILRERKDEEAQAAAALAAAVAASAEQAASRAAQRGGRRGRGRGRGHQQGYQEIPEHPSYSNNRNSRSAVQNGQQNLQREDSNSHRNSARTNNSRQFQHTQNNEHYRHSYNQGENRSNSNNNNNNSNRVYSNGNSRSSHIQGNRRNRNDQNTTHNTDESRTRRQYYTPTANAVNHRSQNVDAVVHNYLRSNEHRFQYYGNNNSTVNQLINQGLVNSNFRYPLNQIGQISTNNDYSQWLSDRTNFYQQFL